MTVECGVYFIHIPKNKTESTFKGKVVCNCINISLYEQEQCFESFLSVFIQEAKYCNHSFIIFNTIFTVWKPLNDLREKNRDCFIKIVQLLAGNK